MAHGLCASYSYTPFSIASRRPGCLTAGFVLMPAIVKNFSDIPTILFIHLGACHNYPPYIAANP